MFFLVFLPFIAAAASTCKLYLLILLGHCNVLFGSTLCSTPVKVKGSVPYSSAAPDVITSSTNNGQRESREAYQRI